MPLFEVHRTRVVNEVLNIQAETDADAEREASKSCHHSEWEETDSENEYIWNVVELAGPEPEPVED